MDRITEATKAFCKVRDYFIAENQCKCRAYRLAWKKPMRFYREHSTDEAVEILKREAGEL